MVKVLSAGFYTTIQDFGRAGYQHYGVPVSGVMDKGATKMANTLIGNKEDAAVLEITMSGPKLEFNCATVIAITGAKLSPKLNEVAVPNNKLIVVNNRDVLTFGKLASGCRCYLATSGGFIAPKVLGSKSMFANISEDFRIKRGDILNISQESTFKKKLYASVVVDDTYLKSSIVTVLKGPEFDMLSVVEKKALFSEIFTISKDNNRMAYQLVEPLQNSLNPIITAPVLPGTVQLTPSGKLLVLMRDCQTTGGYPRILQLTEAAIDTLSQKITGQALIFKVKDSL